MNDARPNPDALLAEVQREQRGKLRIYLGMAPGVGKTYEMLTAAQKKRAAGIDVVVGLVETHGRKETAALLEGLELLARKAVPHQGRVLEELDLDALLARRPQLALVDELAHSNAPGSRHPKRWQDVEELIAAGIDVFTTLNVQHVESLNDVVAQITRVRVRETVPDDVLDAADDIELMDLTPMELVERLREGKVYGGEGGERALANYFTPANLTALRELALRRTAERVEDQLQQHRLRQGVRDVWAAGENVLVCLDGSPSSTALVRAGRRLADRLNAPWTTLHLETPRSRNSAAQQARIAAALRLTEELGGEARTLPARLDLADDLLDYARQHNFTQLLVGKAQRARWFEWLHGSVVDALVRRAQGLTVVVLAEERAAEKQEPAASARPFELGPAVAYAESIASLGLVTAAGFAVDSFIDIPNVSLAYLPVVMRAAIRYGQTPALITALLAAVAYNVFFTEPVFTFHIASLENLLAFGFFGTIAVLVSRLTARLQEQTLLARQQADTTANLLAFARRVSSLRRLDELLAATAAELKRQLAVDAVLLLPDERGQLGVRASAASTAEGLSPADLAAAQWCWDKGLPAGRGAATLPGARKLFLPVRTVNATVAVAGVSRPDEAFLLDATQRRLLESVCDLAGVGIERVRLAKNVDQAKMSADQERLRASMLTAVSHDLRTPLAGILGAVSSVRAYGEQMPAAERQALLVSAEEQTQRLSRFIGNLLDLTRIDAGAFNANAEPLSLHEAVQAYVANQPAALAGRKLVLRVPAELPLLQLDPSLFEHILGNLLDNASKYTPEGSPVEITATQHRYSIILEVRDFGPGIPEHEQGKVFDLFHRVRAGDKTRAGTGLGLAIVRGFAQAMGVEVRVRNHPEGGAVFELEFPAKLIAAAPANEDVTGP